MGTRITWKICRKKLCKKISKKALGKAHFGSLKALKKLLASFYFWAFWSFMNVLRAFHLNFKHFSDSMGRFTMMVNDRPSDVGCALVRYSSEDLFHVFFTCNYGSNNHLGQKVYETGTSCSNCVTGCNKLWPALCSDHEKIDPNHIHIDTLRSFNRRR